MRHFSFGGVTPAWVAWFGPTCGFPERLGRGSLDAGIAIAGIDVGESHGSPEGRRGFDALHAEMTGRRGYASKPVLLGRSRGGLMTLSQAAENPDKAGVPLFAIHGDVDAVVPLEANSGLVRERYTALGGSMQLVVPPGQGHTTWSGFFQDPELVRFVLTYALPAIATKSSGDRSTLP